MTRLLATFLTLLIAFDALAHLRISDLIEMTSARSLQNPMRLSPRQIPFHLNNLTPCEDKFLNFMAGKLPGKYSGNTVINLWDEAFESRILGEIIGELPNRNVRFKLLEEMIGYEETDFTYFKNLTMLANNLIEHGHLRASAVRNLFVRDLEISGIRFGWLQRGRRLTIQRDIPEDKMNLITQYLRGQHLSAARRREYREILVSSNRSKEEIQDAINHGMTLRNSDQALDQFKLYIEFLNDAKTSIVNRGMRHIEGIYDFNYQHGFQSLDPLRNPHIQFLAQRSRLSNYESKRFREILRKLSIEMDNVPENLQSLVVRIRNGERLADSEYRLLEDGLDSVDLGSGLRSRALRQAAGEREIYRRILNGCNSGASPHLRSATQKFRNFKYLMSLTVTPAMYALDHREERNTDPNWEAKLAFETLVAISYSFFASKIVTNPNTSFWGKVGRSYAAFSAIDVGVALTYEDLFGTNDHIRFISQFFNPGVSESELMRNFEQLKNSPTFQTDLTSLITELESYYQRRNTQNVLNRFFNFSEEFRANDLARITQEDLESENYREIMLEALSQKMYQDNMGSWPLFQTGNRGGDRWLFNRARAIPFTIEGVALNLAIFQMLCREPFGRVGSYMAATTMVLVDKFISDSLTFRVRRDVIGQ